MKIKKIGVVNEVIDGDNTLIGANKTPAYGGDLETKASGTTDDNQKKSAQPYSFDSLSRFGFYFGGLFFENDDNENQDDSDKTNDPMFRSLAELMYQKFLEILEYYYKNPNKLKNDYRELHDKSFDQQPKEKQQVDFETAERVLKTIQPFFQQAIDTAKEELSESVVKEDSVLKDKSKKWLETKTKDNELGDENLKHVADLIKRLDKDDINTLITLIDSKQ